jgi:hypothetical protein
VSLFHSTGLGTEDSGPVAFPEADRCQIFYISFVIAKHTCLISQSLGMSIRALNDACAQLESLALANLQLEHDLRGEVVFGPVLETAVEHALALCTSVGRALRDCHSAETASSSGDALLMKWRKEVVTTKRLAEALV